MFNLKLVKEYDAEIYKEGRKQFHKTYEKHI